MKSANLIPLAAAAVLIAFTVTVSALEANAASHSPTPTQPRVRPPISSITPTDPMAR